MRPVRFLPALCCAALTAWALPCAAGDAPKPAAAPAKRKASKRRVGLPRCLRLADRNHPNLLVARAKLDQTRAKLQEAYYAPFMQFRAVGGVAIAPTVRGSNIFSPNTDVSLTSNLGIAWRMSVDGVLPLWTFGKISSLWDAAEANVALNEAGVQMARDTIRFDVRKAYYGLQLSRDALHLLGDATRQIEKAVSDLKKKVAEDDADPIDLYKLQTFSAELYARRAQAERFERIALAGLRFYTGVKDLDIPDEPIAPPKHQLRSVDRYVGASRLHRPEVHMAKAGVAARRAQVAQSRADLYPDVGLVLNASFSTAPEVADQISPFVNDPGNFFRYGAALVVRWNLDVMPRLARVSHAEAQLDEVLALDKQAKDGVTAQVQEAYAEVVDWQKRREAYGRAAKTAKKWLVTVKQAIDVGTMEDKDLIDPAKAFAEQRYNVLNATMELNLAMAKLARATGWDAIAPDGR